MSDDTRLLLIVEDDESFSTTLRRSFERRGYMVVSAASHVSTQFRPDAPPSLRSTTA